MLNLPMCWAVELRCCSSFDEAAELEAWVSAGYETAGHFYRKKAPSDWWPLNGISGQGAATSWAWATILHAARARHDGHEIRFSSPWHGHRHEEIRKAIVSTLWLDDIKRTHEPYEVLLDYTFHDWDSNHPIWMTAESEVYAGHGVGDSITASNDYSWDFYKLLVIPSPLRLIIARVGAVDGVSGRERRNQLVATLKTIVGWWGRSLLRPASGTEPGDDLGVVILPECGVDDEWKDLRLLCHHDGPFEEHTPWA